MLGVQHLDVPHLRGRTSKDTEIGKSKETTDCISEGRTDKGRVKKKKGVESTKEVDTSEQVGTSGNGGRVKKDKTDRKKKTKTRTWSNVVKGLEPKDDSAATDSDKSWNESQTTDLVLQKDPEEPDQFKAKRTRRQ